MSWHRVCLSQCTAVALGVVSVAWGSRLSCVYLCLSVSVCVCMCLSVSVCVCLRLSVSVSPHVVARHADRSSVMVRHWTCHACMWLTQLRAASRLTPLMRKGAVPLCDIAVACSSVQSDPRSGVPFSPTCATRSCRCACVRGAVPQAHWVRVWFVTAGQWRKGHPGGRCVPKAPHATAAGCRVVSEPHHTRVLWLARSCMLARHDDVHRCCCRTGQTPPPALQRRADARFAETVGTAQRHETDSSNSRKHHPEKHPGAALGIHTSARAGCTGCEVRCGPSHRTAHIGCRGCCAPPRKKLQWLRMYILLFKPHCVDLARCDVVDDGDKTSITGVPNRTASHEHITHAADAKETQD